MIFQKIVFTFEEMEKLGAQLAKQCVQKTPGLVIYLKGPLGAGKTTFTRGFLRGMDYQGVVKSPTYTLVETYDLKKNNVNHFDFYRINSPEELEFIGIRDYFIQGYHLLEWPEKAEGTLPISDLTIAIQIDENTRKVDMEAHTKRGKDVLQTFL